MGTRELLEQDKERLLQRLESAGQPQEAIRIMEDEVSRILYKYNQDCQDERVSEEALYSLQTVQAALPLADSAGQVSAFLRTSAGPRKQAGAGSALPLTASVVMAAAAVLVMVFAGKGSMLTCLLIALLLTAGSLGLAFYAGRKSGNAPARPAAGEQYYEVSLDSNKLYHSLLAIQTVVDRNLGEVENASRLTRADSAEIRREADTPQLNLLADLLEQAYTQREEEWAEEIISEISFYLHRKGIDTLDYSPDRSKWFDMMPAQSDGTLRPALVEDGVLLKKGLAAAVYRN